MNNKIIPFPKERTTKPKISKTIMQRAKFVMCKRIKSGSNLSSGFILLIHRDIMKNAPTTTKHK